MAGNTAILAIKIISDAKRAADGFDAAGGGVSRLQRGLGKASAAATVVGAGLVGMAAQAGHSASELQQAQGAVESVFKGQAGAVDELARKASGSVGLAESEYSNLASVLGSQLKNLGISQDELVGTTDGLIGKGADLAATFGGTTSEAVEALTAAFRGETDPIEKYGISIKEADIKAQMAADGTSKLTGAAAKQAKTQAILKMINKQSADATGQFAREQGSAAGAAQIAAANYENAKAHLGQALLPIMAKAASVAAGLAKAVGDHPRAFQIAAAAIGILAAAILVAQGASVAYSVALGVQAFATGAGTAAIAANRLAMGAYAATTAVVKGATLAWAGVQWVLNAALSANPIALVVIAIAALVAGIIWAWNNVAWFRDGILAAWQWIKDVSKTVWDWLSQAIPKAWQAIVDFFKAANPVPIIAGMWNWVKSVSAAAWRWIKSAVGVLWKGIVFYFRNLNPVGFIITHWKQIRETTTRAWQAVSGFISGIWRRITGFINSGATRVGSFVGRSFWRIKDTAVNAFNAVRSAVSSRIGGLVSVVASLPGRAVRALGDLYGRLRNSGQSLINGFIQGIRDSIGRVAQAARDVVNTARDYFPFSPAKTGPLAGRGYVTHSGRALVSDFAGAMNARVSAVRLAAARVTGAAALGGTVKGTAHPAAAGGGGVVIQAGAIRVDGFGGNDVGQRIVDALDAYFRRRGRSWR